MAEQTGFGVVLKIMISTTLTAVVNLLDIDFPAQEKELADVTKHPATSASGYREWMDTGIRSLSEFTAMLGWDDVPMHRWGQSQMFRSLAFYLREADGSRSRTAAISAVTSVGDPR